MTRQEHAQRLVRDIEHFYRDRPWCRDRLAEDAAGQPCEPTSPEAVAFCFIGAVCALYGCQPGRFPQHVSAALDGLALSLMPDYCTVSGCNDGCASKSDLFGRLASALERWQGGE